MLASICIIGKFWKISCSLVRSGIYFDQIVPSGVVGNFLLWERSHGIMVTYPIVLRRGGGVVPE